MVARLRLANINHIRCEADRPNSIVADSRAIVFSSAYVNAPRSAVVEKRPWANLAPHGLAQIVDAGVMFFMGVPELSRPFLAHGCL